jgi:ubiquinone/menaquinone biosynthesis C-methylase UbiE
VITVDFKQLRIRPGYRILDIGCGTGRHTSAVFQFKKITVIGADRNINGLCEARNRIQLHERLGEHGCGRWALAAADIAALPFKNDVFDLVICCEVLEHVARDTIAANELIRVLKPGHNLAVSVPRYLPERICWALSKDYTATDNGHIRIYRKKKLIRCLEGLGLKSWAVHYAHSLHTPYWWLKCLVGPDRENAVMVNLYHRFLSWDIMNKPKLTGWMDRLLNPVLGKSLVVYFKKEKK